MAPLTAPTKLAAMYGTRFGMTSRNSTPNSLSPFARATQTYERSRIDSTWARIERVGCIQANAATVSPDRRVLGKQFEHPVNITGQTRELKLPGSNKIKLKDVD